MQHLTDEQKKEALDRALAARDRGIVPEKLAPRRKNKRRSRAKVLSVIVIDGARERPQ